MGNADHNENSRETVLVTGASDGLGRALARHYVARGAQVIAVARTARGLTEELPGVKFIAADLAGAGAIAPLCDAVRAAIGASGRLDRVIHNAALGWYGAIEAMPRERIEPLLIANLWAPIALTHALAPLVGAAHGQVAFIGSIAAFVPAARYAVYAASKAALDGLVRSLRVELAGTIGVQAIHPGPIATAFHAKAGVTDVDTRRFPSAETVARGVVRAIERGRWRAFSSRGIGLASAAGRVLAPIADRAALARERGRPDTKQTAAQASPPRAAGAAASPSGLRAGIGEAPLAIVTGAASGLGAAIVARLIADGYRVHAIDVEPVAVAGDGMSVHRCDLRDATALTALGARLPAQVSLVIHSAGTSAVGPFLAQPLTALDSVWRTNLLAPIALTGELLVAGKLAPRSSVVLVASLSHFVGYPGAAVYAASKDGLAAYGRSLDVALRARGLGQRCLTVFPGPMRTPHARTFAPAGASEARRVDPDVVARAILAAVVRRRSRLVPGAGAALAAIAGTLAPDALTRMMGVALWPKLRERAIIAPSDDKPSP